MDQEPTTIPTNTAEPIKPVETKSPADEKTPAPKETTTPPTDNKPSDDSATVEHRVPLRTVLLILVLAILAAVLIFVALNPVKKTVTKLAPTPTTKPSIAHTILAMTMDTDASSSSTTNSLSKSVSVTVTTGTNKIEGVQFEISYDPTILTNVTVTPGTFFTNPIILLNSVDTKNGKINYALGIQPTATDALSGGGTVAKISYTMLPTSTASLTHLTFLPKTQAIQKGTLGSVLEKAIDLTIPVVGLTPAATKITTPVTQ